jgi:hypothetical protein
MKNQAKFVKSLKAILKKEMDYSNKNLSSSIGDMRLSEAAYFQTVIATIRWVQDQIACYEQYGEFKR